MKKSMQCYIFFGFLPIIFAAEVALFPSSGCYSHDVMMKEIGLEFPNDNVSWAQIYLYEFGFGEAKLPQTWRKFITNRVTEEGKRLTY